MYLYSFQLIPIVYIPFISRLENGLSREPKRRNKMFKHDSTLLSYKMVIQNKMKIIPTEVKIKFRYLEKISLKYSASKAHRQFNITCIYIYIYSYSYTIYSFEANQSTVELNEFIYKTVQHGCFIHFFFVSHFLIQCFKRRYSV